MTTPEMTTPGKGGAGLGWAVARAAEVPVSNGWLGATEREVLATLSGERKTRRRADWRLGRFTAKRLLARRLALEEDAGELARIEVLAADDGAPEPFLDGEPLSLALSLAHRAGLGLAAVADPPCRLGCDVERIEPRSTAFVGDFFTAGEARWVAEAPNGRRALLANLLWSAKESALKADRSGLRRDTRGVEVRAPGWLEVVESVDLDCVRWGALEADDLERGRRLAGGWWWSGDLLFTLLGDRLAESPFESPSWPGGGLGDRPGAW